MAQSIPTNPILIRSVIAAAALATCRFVTSTGNYSAAGGYAVGATVSSGPIGEPVPTVFLGTAEVEVGEAIAAGAAVMSDATGRAMNLTGVNTKTGRALTAATAAGQSIEVLLVTN